MTDVLYLAWRYLLFNRWKTAVLIAAITVTMFLPLALDLVPVGNLAAKLGSSIGQHGGDGEWKDAGLHQFSAGVDRGLGLKEMYCHAGS